MICNALCDLVIAALREKLGDAVTIEIGHAPVEPVKGHLFVKVPSFDFTRRRFSTTSEDKSQRITISVEIVYYPEGDPILESGRLEIFAALGKIYMSGSDLRLEEYSARSNRDHIAISAGYSFTLEFFGLS